MCVREVSWREVFVEKGHFMAASSGFYLDRRSLLGQEFPQLELVLAVVVLPKSVRLVVSQNENNIGSFAFGSCRKIDAGQDEGKYF